MPIDVSPFVSSIADAPGNVRLHGLVRKTTFDRDTRRIGDRWVLTLVLLLVLAALTWPLLKLWYMVPAERLRGFDVRIMTLAMTVLAGVVTLVIAQTAWQRALQQWLDGRLEEVAAGIADVMDREFAAASENWRAPKLRRTRRSTRTTTSISSSPSTRTRNRCNGARRSVATAGGSSGSAARPRCRSAIASTSTTCSPGTCRIVAQSGTQRPRSRWRSFARRRRASCRSCWPGRPRQDRERRRPTSPRC